MEPSGISTKIGIDPVLADRDVDLLDFAELAGARTVPF
jgi:hypothetical protein